MHAFPTQREEYFGVTRKTRPRPIGAGFGEMIREARDRAGWTQAELADAVGLRDSTISNLELEYRRPDFPDSVNALITALNLPAVEFVQALGLRLSLPRASSRLPRRLLDALVELPPDEIDALTLLAERAADAVRRERGPGP